MLSFDHKAFEAWKAKQPKEFQNERFEWHFLLSARWNVALARYLCLKDSGRKVQQVKIDRFVIEYGYMDQNIDNFAIPVDIEKAMQTNLDDPLIIIRWEYMPDKFLVLPIDGHHRLYHAAQIKREYLPTYLLNEQEEELCRL